MLSRELFWVVIIFFGQSTGCVFRGNSYKLFNYIKIFTVKGVRVKLKFLPKYKLALAPLLHNFLAIHSDKNPVCPSFSPYIAQLAIRDEVSQTESS